MKVNGKSIMELLTIAAARGRRSPSGPMAADEEKAVESLAELVNTGFGSGDARRPGAHTARLSRPRPASPSVRRC
jgi:hypothetical protein